MSEEAKWYVIHTYSGYENKVASTLQTTVENRGLQDMIPDVKVPTEIVTEIKEDGSSKEVERKLFPGYVFVKMVYTDETWYVVRNIRGCTGFVGPSSKPVPLTESEVYKMGVESRVVEVSYDVGDQVRIIDGPLEDFVGIVDELDTDKNYVKVTISMFGRETPVSREVRRLIGLLPDSGCI
nr:transcription termination/antitermination protein NusG [uncultured Ruminococcus sp.]